MASKAEALRAKHDRIAQQQTEPEGKRVGTQRTAGEHVRAAPVRKSIDLPQKRAAALSAWEAETAQILGRSRVTSADVVRALIARLLTDETLARKIRNDLAENE